MEKKLRLYKAIILDRTKDQLGERVAIMAASLGEAKNMLEEKHGKGTIFDLHNVEDANQVR
jgi:hypothetical protein